MKDHLLKILRDKNIPLGVFRQTALQLAELIAAEAISAIKPERALLVPILRAGMSLLPSFLNYFLEAPIGFFGIRRDEKTATPILYYENIPPIQPSDTVFILDPMVATAGSSLLAIQRLVEKGASKIVLIGIIASTEGLQKIRSQYPYVSIFVAAVDPSLDSHHFIVPGLGDFGDRFFGTH